MKIVSVINYKGGVGKTTVTANLAGELANRGKNVLLIDTDAQASLTFSFVTPDKWSKDYEKTKTIKTWFDAICEGREPLSLSEVVITPEKVNALIRSKGGNIDLIPSHLGLINVDLELATLLGGANLSQNKRNYIKVHGRLRNAISELVSASNYDIVLIDCPPNFNIVTKNAIIASDGILVPAKPDYLSTMGIDFLKSNVNSLVREFNEYSDINIDPRMLGVIFTMIQITSGHPIAAQRQYIAQTKRLGIHTLDNMIRNNNTLFADAPQFLFPVVLGWTSGATYQDIVVEIKKFVSEFESLLVEE